MLEGHRDTEGHLTFPPWPLPEVRPRRQMRVAVVLDDFSRLAFSYEWNQVEVKPSSWRQVLTDDPPELLFVESAWHGNGDAWRYHLTGTSAPRPEFVALVGWCKTNGIPTVFWNKEDPAHYDDFLDSARLFDHVFTTDANRLDDYRRDLGHDRVGLLPFGAQQSIHNPVRPAGGHQHRDIAFAGMYFAHRYPERREQMDLLLGAAEAVSTRMDTGLEIFSRYLGKDDRYQFPPPLDRRVVGSLSYDRMLSANRAYKVFLNVNSVVDSPSMCARRIFEITASGTPVVSTPSPAIENYFTADMVAQVHDRQEAEHTLRALVRSPELRDRMVHLGQRRIWSEHTYTRRVDDVLSRLDADQPPRQRPTVSVLISTNRPGQVEHVLTTVAAQQDVQYELLILAHGFELPRAETQARARELGIDHTDFLSAGSRTPLGECLNILARAANGEVVAKVDDDDLYGPQYLSDQVYAMDYAGADVVGKQAHFMYLADRDAAILRFPEREHRYTDFVAGPTIVARRDLVLSHPFPAAARGEDTGFLEAASAAGAVIYSADRFNFIQHRHGSDRESDGHRHTWNATDTELLANGDVAYYGPNPAHVLL